MTTEAEVGVIGPQVKERRQPLDTGKGKKTKQNKSRLSPRTRGGYAALPTHPKTFLLTSRL